MRNIYVVLYVPASIAVIALLFALVYLFVLRNR